jgi:DNA-binding NarL/FixJ family response regulator
MSATILAVDDDPNFRAVVRGLLQKDADVELVGEAENGEDAVSFVRNLRPDVVLMDLTMPRVDGFEATKRIKSYQPEIKVIVLTIHAGSEFEQASISTGADAFIVKKRLSSELLPTIHGLLSKDPNRAGIRDPAQTKDNLRNL